VERVIGGVHQVEDDLIQRLPVALHEQVDEYLALAHPIKLGARHGLLEAREGRLGSQVAAGLRGAAVGDLIEALAQEVVDALANLPSLAAVSQTGAR